MIHKVKGFSVVSETEVDVFLEFPCFLYDLVNVDNLISGSSAFSKPSLNIWKFSVHIMLRPSLEDFECNLTSMGSEYNCPVWTFFSTALLGIEMRVDLFQSWGQLGIPNLLTYWVQLIESSLRILNSSSGIPSPPLALLTAVLPKAHFASHSRMSGSTWETVPLWLSGSLRSFLYSSSVYSFHLFLISSVSTRSLPFLSFIYCAHLWVKCSLYISNFLEEISGLTLSVFLFFFALFSQEGLLVSPCYSLKLCI